MGRLLDKSQIDWLQDARFGLLNFSASGASGNVTSALTTAVTTIGNGGVAVPLQVASAASVGLIVTTPNNLCRIVATSTKRPIADASNNEVYGRLTHNAGVYTLTYFSLVNGTETAYSFPSATNVDFYPVYRFDAARYPVDANVSTTAALIQDDPIVTIGGTTLNTPVLLTVTATNTLSALPVAPSAANRIFLNVNGKTEHTTGGSPAFSVSGTTVTWNAANAGYSLLTTFEVYAIVW